MAKIFEVISSRYKYIKHAPAGVVVAGAHAEVNDLDVFSLTDLAATEEGVWISGAPRVKAKKNEALAINEGDKVYYDVADGNVNKDASGNHAVGHAVEAAATADTHVIIEFDGTLADTP